MKKITQLILSILVLMTISSCKEEYLETRPLSFYAPENVYLNEEGFEALVVTMKKNFALFGYDQFSIVADQYSYSDLCVPGSFNPLTIRDLTNNLSPAVSEGDTRFQFHNRLFDQAYTAIRTPNVLITRIQDVEMDVEAKNFYLANAYFYRSYWYYLLTNTYGDIPFIGEEITGPKLDFYSHSRKAILTKLQSDLEFAVEWLPVSANIGEATKGAANHLLTKVYLANLEFEKAIISATEVINGPYELMRNRFGVDADDPTKNMFWDLHRVDNINDPSNTETIASIIDRFEAPENAQNIGIQSNRYLGNVLPRIFNPQWWHPTTLDSEGKNGTVAGGPQYDWIFRGAATARPSVYYLYNIWEPNDLRRSSDNWVEKEEILYNNESSVDYGQPIDPENFANPIDSFTNLYAIPQYLTFVPEQNPPGDGRGGSGDSYVFRLAETYLLRAEAYLWNNQVNLAVQDLNIIRDRAGLLPITDLDIDVIMDERARELFTEEPRHAELTRVSYIMAELNLAGYNLSDIYQNNYFYDRSIDTNVFWRTNYRATFTNQDFRISPFHFLWPIPETVIVANTQGVINQNFGYSGTASNVPPLEVID